MNPPPEPRPLVAVHEVRIIAGTAHRGKPTWVLVLACGHTVRRVTDMAPKHARCDHCVREAAE